MDVECVLQRGCAPGITLRQLNGAEMTEKHDIGGGHSISYYVRGDDEALVGLIDRHRDPDGNRCSGSVLFDIPQNADITDHPKWQVINLDPLTLSPSLLCGCGEHGWIRDGRWVGICGS